MPFALHDDNEFGLLPIERFEGGLVVVEIGDVEGNDEFVDREAVGHNIDTGFGTPNVDVVVGRGGLADKLGKSVVAGHARVEAVVVLCAVDAAGDIGEKVVVIRNDWVMAKMKAGVGRTSKS